MYIRRRSCIFPVERCSPLCPGRTTRMFEPLSPSHYSGFSPSEGFLFERGSFRFPNAFLNFGARFSTSFDFVRPCSGSRLKGLFRSFSVHPQFQSPPCSAYFGAPHRTSLTFPFHLSVKSGRPHVIFFFCNTFSLGRLEMFFSPRSP